MNLKQIAITIAALGYQLPLLASTPSGVFIKNIRYNGTGCPAYSVSKNLSRDAKAFTLTFSDYIAEVGPGVSRREARKNCQVTVDLDFPMGWQYAVMSFDYRGFASLDRGVVAEQGVSYYFQGQGYTGRSSSRLRGEFDDDWQFRDRIGLDTYVWSPCGEKRALNINSYIKVKNRNRRNKRAEGIIGTDSMDGQITQQYGLTWRRCY